MPESPPRVHNGGMERMTAGFWWPLIVHPPYHQQQQQMMMGMFYFPMVVAPPPNYPVINPLQSTNDQPFTNLGNQSNQPRADEWMMSSFLPGELARARERITELEACLRRTEEEKKRWESIASEYMALKASDASDAASCTGHPLEIEEPSEPKRKKPRTRRYG